MNDLNDRLDALAREATGDVDFPPLGVATRARRRRRAASVALAVAGVLLAAGSLWTTARGGQPEQVRIAAPSGANGVSPGRPPGSRPAPLPDPALTPAGWSPVAYGSVQVSVPSDWEVTNRTVACYARVPGAISPGAPLAKEAGYCAAGDATASDLVSIVRASRVPVPHGRSGVVNSIPVRAGWSEPQIPRGVSIATLPPRIEVLRALGYDITAIGPLAQRVLATLTYSPRSVVLGSRVAKTPADWRQLAFGGLRFAAPANWAPHRSSDLYGGCTDNLDPPATVWLSTARFFLAYSCSANVQTAATTTGVPGAVVESGPRIHWSVAGATCSSRDGLRVCVEPQDSALPPGPSVLTAQVRVPGQAQVDQIELGLSGTGITALEIFDSLRPAG